MAIRITIVCLALAACAAYVAEARVSKSFVRGFLVGYAKGLEEGKNLVQVQPVFLDKPDNAPPHHGHGADHSDHHSSHHYSSSHSDGHGHGPEGYGHESDGDHDDKKKAASAKAASAASAAAASMMQPVYVPYGIANKQ